MVVASEFSTLYKFPLGRCAFALRSVEQRARAVGASEIAELARRGVDQAQKAMDLVMRFQAGHGGQYPPETTAMDNVVDRYLGGASGYLDVQMRVYAGEPRGDSAAHLARVLFPQGVAAITHLAYPEEHEQINIILERTRSADLAEHVSALPEMSSLLERLRLRNHEYGELLRHDQDLPSREEIRHAHDQSQERLVETVDLIFGLYALRSPDKTAERDHLLEPIVQQNNTLGILRRRRRVPTDVDPQTGEELPGPSEDLPGEGNPEEPEPAIHRAGVKDDVPVP